MLAEIALELVFELVWKGIEPVVLAVCRVIQAMQNRWTAGLLWIGAAASTAWLARIGHGASPGALTLATTAFMLMTLLALMATFHVRRRSASRYRNPRSRAARRHGNRSAPARPVPC